MEENRATPDELLKAIQIEEKKAKSGKLKIFFGMSAGVGKTYSMLEEAQDLVKKGVDVVVGVVNTHGRKETEALLEGLSLIPEKWINYRNTVFKELDVDAIIARQPEIVLVDELAHTNVPGSKHEKRWQDVLDILEAGIDVYTTLNVQHVESRKDLVEGVTGIQIRETVPDSVLEKATTIEMVDIPPQELLQRMKEGKVYLGDQPQIAIQHFFKEDNLNALREIALRFTAEKIDHDLFQQRKRIRTHEKLMVAVACSPSAEQLLRVARRLAFERHATWIAVYVDTGLELSDEDQTRLYRNLNLARDLGAEVITIHDLDVATALNRIAQQKNITQLVIGRPPQRKLWPFFGIFKEGFIERIERENKNVDIVIVRKDKAHSIYERTFKSKPKPQFVPNISHYFLVALFIGFLTLIAFPLSTYIDYTSVGFILLLGILALSFIVGQGPIIFAAFLSTISWNFFFVLPTFTAALATEYILQTIVFFCTALVIGTLTSRIRYQEQYMEKREKWMEYLYELETLMANSTHLYQLRSSLVSRLEEILDGRFAILAKDNYNRLVFDSTLPALEHINEQSVAEWVFRNGKMAGWSTDTLPLSQGIYVPIKFGERSEGVLVFYPLQPKRFLSSEEKGFLLTISRRLGMYMEKYAFEETVRVHHYAKHIEQLHHAILHSVSKAIYNPLDKLNKVCVQIKAANPNLQIQEYIKEADIPLKNLQLIVENFITLSEFESGFVVFDKKKHRISDLVNTCLNEIKPWTEGRNLYVNIPDELCMVSFDFNLTKLALKNLIVNALAVTPLEKEVKLNAEVGYQCLISVTDGGPTIPPDQIPHLFDRFHISEGVPSETVGLALVIVKTIVDIHNAKIDVKPAIDGGNIFTLIFND
jgi:two-component system sensor histidine kinase KdpD